MNTLSHLSERPCPGIRPRPVAEPLVLTLNSRSSILPPSNKRAPLIPPDSVINRLPLMDETHERACDVIKVRGSCCKLLLEKAQIEDRHDLQTAAAEEMSGMREGYIIFLIGLMVNDWYSSSTLGFSSSFHFFGFFTDNHLTKRDENKQKVLKVPSVVPCLISSGHINNLTGLSIIQVQNLDFCVLCRQTD